MIINDLVKNCFSVFIQKTRNKFSKDIINIINIITTIVKSTNHTKIKQQNRHNKFKNCCIPIKN